MRENLDLINENMLRHWYDLYIADETYDLLLCPSSYNLRQMAI